MRSISMEQTVTNAGLVILLCDWFTDSLVNQVKLGTLKRLEATWLRLSRI